MSNGDLTLCVHFYSAHLQLIEVTGKTQDECMVALHDCNEDVNRAINFLLESTSDTVSVKTCTNRIYTHILCLCSHHIGITLGFR